MANGHPTVVLKNRFLVARFSKSDGRLLHLSSDGRGAGLIGDVTCRYQDESAKLWHADKDVQPKGGGFETAGVQADGNSVTVSRRSEHLLVTLRYELEPGSPLLKVSTSVRGTGKPGALRYIFTPRFDFAPGFNDTFEDERDLYYDGAELGGGKELPCWRVFFRKGYRTGLILATRRKLPMAQFHIEADGFAMQPHNFTNYTSAWEGIRAPFDPTKPTLYAASFEMGPWSQSKHKTILQAAKLEKPVQVEHKPAKGTPKPNLRGHVLYAVDFVPRAAASKSYHPGKWMLAEMPWAQKGKALFATTGVRPPEISLDPKLRGLYHVFVGIGNGAGAVLRLAGDPEARYRIGPGSWEDDMSRTFGSALAGTHRPKEVDFGVIELDGQPITLCRFPDTQQPCVIDYIRFEELAPAAVRRWQRQEQAEPALPLSGFADIADIAALLDTADPDPRAYTANIWEHANSKVNKIFWRVDGQCSDYASKVNTMRYVSAKVHGVFVPRAKAYGLVLRKADMLKLSVEAARRYGASLWGWMRFNSYMGNVMSDFYKQHPEYWEEWDSGRKGGKLCLAWPEVRKHKIAILVEAASYGLDGLSLGFLRHPPVVQYAKVMCDAYEKEFGRQPPRDPKHPDAHRRFILPENDPKLQRWWQFRAGYLTTFGRELKAALRGNGLEHVKISIWVRPNHCLFDGIDLPVWLNEGLCDEVVSQMYVQGNYNPEIYWETPEWKEMVRSKVPLIRAIFPSIKDARQDVKRILAGGYDGICCYESNDTVLNTDFISLFRSLRR